MINKNVLKSIVTCKFCLRKKLHSFVVRLFSFFTTSKYFVLLEVIFLLKLISLLSKSVLPAKLACVKLAAKFSAANLLILE